MLVSDETSSGLGLLSSERENGLNGVDYDKQLFSSDATIVGCVF